MPGLKSKNDRIVILTVQHPECPGQDLFLPGPLGRLMSAKKTRKKHETSNGWIVPVGPSTGSITFGKPGTVTSPEFSKNFLPSFSNFPEKARR
ncbi:Hypothetical protein NTJ_09969 [Nesidiocoris tenuis]|uniref:Uncharacterized protein n=1 Tax=Nesidiocoris tenuis TaxID=355587 RepID=A0ABN7B0P9_9HEMI|nr:Hypothetical protein NTJ_09969 [Nesidiocoris tenuis]